MLFVDKSQNNSDTINVFIPAEPVKNSITVTEAAAQTTVADNVTHDSLATASFQNTMLRQLKMLLHQLLLQPKVMKLQQQLRKNQLLMFLIHFINRKL